LQRIDGRVRWGGGGQSAAEGGAVDGDAVQEKVADYPNPNLKLIGPYLTQLIPGPINLTYT